MLHEYLHPLSHVSIRVSPCTLAYGAHGPTVTYIYAIITFPLRCVVITLSSKGIQTCSRSFKAKPAYPARLCTHIYSNIQKMTNKNTPRNVQRHTCSAPNSGHSSHAHALGTADRLPCRVAHLSKTFSRRTFSLHVQQVNLHDKGYQMWCGTSPSRADKQFRQDRYVRTWSADNLIKTSNSKKEK